MQIAEATKPKARPKVLESLELKGKLGGGHVVKHRYTDYDSKDYNFNENGVSRGGEHIVDHLIKHAGLPPRPEDEAAAE